MYNDDIFKNPDRHYGPLQIAHDFQFIALNLSENFDWPADSSEEHKLDHIRWRLERLAGRGFGGVVINVAFKDYMEDAAAWERFVKTVDIAKELGLRVWIYDEQYYPSGMSGGLALKGHPELEAQALDCLMRDIDSPSAPLRIPSPHGHSSLKYAFAVPLTDISPVNTPLTNESTANGKDSFAFAPDFTKQVDISSFTDTGGGLCWDCPGGKWRVYCYFTRSHYEGTYLCRTIRSPHRVISTIDVNAVKRFLDVTYGNYGKWLGERLGRDIEVIFADEPGLLAYNAYPANFDPTRRNAPSESIIEIPDPSIPIYPFIHWSDDIEDKFRNYCGYNLKDNLPEIFDGDSEKAFSMRLDYRRTVAAMFDNAYNRQYSELMEGKGMAYSGHYRSIRQLLWHPDTSGDMLHDLGQMQIPGCDRLDSDPAAFRYRIDCKLVSSAAHLYGRKNTMIEASHMYNTKEPLKLDLMLCSIAGDFAQGINIITSYYGENVLKEDEYKIFSAFVSRLSALFCDGIHQTQALLYYPYGQIAYNLPVMAYNSPVMAGSPFTEKGKLSEARAAKAADSFVKVSGQLVRRQVDFDYINDEKLAECRIVKSYIMSPSGETPNVLIFPDISFVCPATAGFIKAALEAGIKVGFMGEKRDIEVLEEGSSDSGGVRRKSVIDSERLTFWGEEADIVSEDFKTDYSCPGLLCMHKKYSNRSRGQQGQSTIREADFHSDHDLYLLVNTDRQDLAFSATIPYKPHMGSDNAGNIPEGGPAGKTVSLKILDPASGRINSLDCVINGGRIYFTLHMEANSAVIIEVQYL